MEGVGKNFSLFWESDRLRVGDTFGEGTEPCMVSSGQARVKNWFAWGRVQKGSGSNAVERERRRTGTKRGGRG